MRNSGVEWIDEIPSGLKVGKFGRYTTVKSNLVDQNLYMEYPQIVPDNIEKGSGRLIDYKSVRDSGVISWIHLFFKGQIIYSKIGLITRDRVKMPKINQNELSGIFITVLSKEEQKCIAEYLNKKCTVIDTIIEQKQKLIEKLTEYKKSLIYECVTGKKAI